MDTGRAFVAGILFILAAAGIAVGVMYLTMSGHALPSFVPGHSASAAAVGKHPKRGYFSLGIGVVLLVGSILLMSLGRRRRHRYRY